MLKPKMKIFLGSLALAPAIGVTMGAAFPPYGYWPLAIVALVALLILTWRLSFRQNLLVWWVSGSTFFLFLLHWLRVVGVDAWLGASLALGLWWVVAATGVYLVRGLPGAPLWIGSIITTVEIMKSRWPWDGFPWGQLAFPLSEGYLGSYLPFIASLGLGWVGATLAACVAWLFRPAVIAPSSRRWVWVGVGAALLLIPMILGPIHGLASQNRERDVEAATGRSDYESLATLNVAMIQGNVPQTGLNFNARRLAILRNHLRLTEEVTETKEKMSPSGTNKPLDLIIWPENSSDIDPYQDGIIYSEISRVADEAGVALLVGAVIENPDNPEQVLNAGIVWQPQAGPTQTYIKQNPVMFGEFVPFRALLTRFIGRFERVPRDFAKGDTPGVFNIDGKPIGDVICFEVANDAVVRDTVRAGAQTLIVQTNNATYNLLGQTEQQLQISQVRAKEFDRFVMVAALSGISAVVNNKGQILKQTGEFESAILYADVPLINSPTLSARFGHIITLIIFSLGLTSAVIGGFRLTANRR